MIERQARDAVLLRAFESPPTAPWSEDDARWTAEEAARRCGADAPLPAFVATRAALGVDRLVERAPAVRTARATTDRSGWLAVGAVVIAFVLGLAGDAIGSGGRVNIVAPPLIGLLAWNVAVYLLLALRATGIGSGGTPYYAGPLRSLLQMLASSALPRLGRIGGDDGPAPALRRFAADWLAASRPLTATRVAAALHAAAAALALGLLASTFLRGLGFEYRAGWDSTFLDVEGVHRIVRLLYGAASGLSGIPLPSVQRLSALRFAAGAGENAAPWLYLQAWTVALVVLLPRLVLGALAARRARALSNDFPLKLDDPYFARTHRDATQRGIDVRVLPYSTGVDAGALGPLRSAIERELGSSTRVVIGDSVPLGGEDEVERWLPDGDAMPIALYALTATPERETHGAFAQALSRRLPAGEKLLVLIDEGGFRARLAGTPELRSRVDERRGAWRRLLRELGIEPVFVDLPARKAATA